MCWQMLPSIIENWQHASTFRPAESWSAGCIACFFLSYMWLAVVDRICDRMIDPKSVKYIAGLCCPTADYSG